MVISKKYTENVTHLFPCLVLQLKDIHKDWRDGKKGEKLAQSHKIIKRKNK